MRYMMRLNDGETYTDLDGCAVIAVRDEIADEDLDGFVKRGSGDITMVDAHCSWCHEQLDFDDIVIPEYRPATKRLYWFDSESCRRAFNLDTGRDGS